MSKFHTSSSTVYFRDKFVPYNQANLSIASAPMLYGLSVYTVFGAFWQPDSKEFLLFRLKDHYRRLQNSAKIMDFNDFSQAWSYQKFEKTMIDLLKRNNPQENVLVRLALFVDEEMTGTRMRGLKNTLAAFIYPMSQLYPEAGINVCVSSWQRTPDNSIPARAKVNGSYANSALMKNEALVNGYDEALAIDEHGHLAEGTVANAFMVRDGVLITPDPSTDLLEGITRDSVLQIAQYLNIPVKERSVDRSELYIADELLMCGSSAQILPILSVDKRPVGNGRSGPITKKLRQTFVDIQTNNLPEFKHWLITV